jgi:hypothetical protein
VVWLGLVVEFGVERLQDEEAVKAIESTDVDDVLRVMAIRNPRDELLFLEPQGRFRNCVPIFS